MARGDAVEDSRRRLLLVLQGMDASGKDGVIKRGLGGMNPKWLDITGFGAPTQEELDHHFLWRIRKALPGARVTSASSTARTTRTSSPSASATSPRRTSGAPASTRSTPSSASSPTTAARSSRSSCTSRRDYQLERQLRRLDRVDKRWKFDEGDLEDRERWPAFQAAYEEVLERCNTAAAPWFVVPADRKWYRMWAVSQLAAGDPARPRPAVARRVRSSTFPRCESG